MFSQLTFPSFTIQLSRTPELFDFFFYFWNWTNMAIAFIVTGRFMMEVFAAFLLWFQQHRSVPPTVSHQHLMVLLVWTARRATNVRPFQVKSSPWCLLVCWRKKREEKKTHKLSRALDVDSASSSRRAAIKISTLEVGRGCSLSCVELQQRWTMRVHVWMLHALKGQACQAYIVHRF